MSFFKKLKEQMIEEAKTTKLEYVGGLPQNIGNTIRIKKGPEPNTISLHDKVYTLVAINWQEQGQRSAGKAATGAIIGGVLTGGIGAVAGAAIGGRKKDSSIAAITVKDSEVQYTAYVRCSQSEYKILTSLL